MSETPPSSGKARGWSLLRISEVVGVLALVIAALGFWDNHTEHQRADRERLAAEQRSMAGPAFVLVATPDKDGDRLDLRPVHDDQVIQSQTFYFPKAVRGDVVNTTGAARIEGDWIDRGLRTLAGPHGATNGDLKAPVGVSTTYLVDGDTRVDQSIYDIGYRLQPRFLRSDRVVLEGLSVVRRGVPGDLQAATEHVAAARGGDVKPLR